MKKPIDPIKNQTRDLLACSTVCERCEKKHVIVMLTIEDLRMPLISWAIGSLIIMLFSGQVA
jgi:hypothetical protein